MSKILEWEVPEADRDTSALQSGGPRWIIEQGRPKYLLPENSINGVRRAFPALLSVL